MYRIPQDDVLPMIDRFRAHWALANALPPGAIVIGGYGLPQLNTQRTQYHTDYDAYLARQTDASTVRSQRDTAWGLTPDDVNGVWFRLGQYGGACELNLPPGQALLNNLPTIGKVTIGEYLDILHGFLNHWTKVNAALVTPMTLGPLTLAQLQTLHNTLDTLIQQADQIENVELPLLRRNLDLLLGDVPKLERPVVSIVTHLEQYRTTLQLNYAGQSIVTEMPDIFPPETSLRTFKFNDLQFSPTEFRLWLQDPNLPNVAVIYLQAGAFVGTQPFTSSATPPVKTTTWPVELTDPVQRVLLRNASGENLARGVRDAALPGG